MTSESIKRELSLMGYNPKDFSVKKVKVAYRNQYEWLIQSSKVNIQIARRRFAYSFPDFIASSAREGSFPA